MSKRKEGKGITAKKEGDFSEWYTQVVEKSEFVDYSEVSGTIIFRPLGYSIWEKLKETIDPQFKQVGIKNTYFPLFIPESALKKEAEHVEGFSPEVAWVTHAGKTKLMEKLAVRPTSEAVMYLSYSKWIRSWRDLPLKLNQWNNVVRWEFKHPVLLLRSREFLWNEGHTAFATKKEAEKEMPQIIKIYSDFLKNNMALPFLVGKKTDKEKFAGAEYTISLELLLPNGKAIQGPDFHHDGQNFAKAYDIKFLNKDGKEDYVWQNTWAITTRMLGVMIATHSDNKGLIIPPNLSPNPIVIVPIIFEDSKKKVLKKAEEIKKSLEKFSPMLDEREGYSPGWKFSEWELKGVPIRIELGPKDLAKNQVVVARRDTGEKSVMKIKELGKKIPLLLNSIQSSLYNKANKFLKQSILEVKNFNDFKKALEDKKIVLAPFCHKTKCEESIKQKSNGAKSLNMPLNQKSLKNKKCFACGKAATVMCHFGKSY